MGRAACAASALTPVHPHTSAHSNKNMPISVKQPKRSSHQSCERREKPLENIDSVDPLKENFPQLGRGYQSAKNRVLGAWAVNLTSKLPASAEQVYAASVSEQETLSKEPKRRWS